MNAALCQLLDALHLVIWIYTLIMLVYAVLSWVPDLRGGWSRYIEMLVEPVLAPIRRVIPPAGGFDWSFIVLFAILWIVDRVVLAQAGAACLF